MHHFFYLFLPIKYELSPLSKTKISHLLPRPPNKFLFEINPIYFPGKDLLCNVRMIIISYDLLPKKQNVLVAKKMQVIVFDECHFLKNYKSQRCKVTIKKSFNRNQVLIFKCVVSCTPRFHT